MSATETQENQMAELEALAELLEAAHEMHEHEQLDPWRLGDKALAYVRTRQPESEDDPRFHTGLYAILDEAASAVEEEAPEIDRGTFRHSYATANAWPPDERMPDKASFNAHQAFNARRFDGRRDKLLREAAREAKNGYVTVKVARLKASESLSRPAVKTPLERTEAAITSALRRLWTPTDRVGPDDRKGIARILRQQAALIESGEPF